MQELTDWYEHHGQGRGVFNGIPYCFGDANIAKNRSFSVRTIQTKLKTGKVAGSTKITSGVCSGWNAAPTQTITENAGMVWVYDEAFVVPNFKEAFDRVERLEEGDTETIIVKLAGVSSDTIIQVTKI